MNQWQYTSGNCFIQGVKRDMKSHNEPEPPPEREPWKEYKIDKWTMAMFSQKGLEIFQCQQYVFLDPAGVEKLSAAWNDWQNRCEG